MSGALRAVRPALSRRPLPARRTAGPRQRFAARRLQARHAGQRNFERDRDLALDFLRRRARKLRVDFDDGRREVGIRFNIDVDE